VESPDVDIRRASADDADAVADVWLRSFGRALPTVRRAHSDAEVRAWIGSVVIPPPTRSDSREAPESQRETWVATIGGGLAAMMVLHDGEIDQLYVDPGYQGRGLGGRLVELAKRRSPSGLALWTFQVNRSAQRFYERHGFVAVERTDGSGNEEQEPDVRYVWTPDPGPVSPVDPVGSVGDSRTDVAPGHRRL
jgi:ribosomal protein S18 acetylase RimI-like enzyme